MGFQSSGICGSLANIFLMADDRGTEPKCTKGPCGGWGEQDFYPAHNPSIPPLQGPILPMGALITGLRMQLPYSNGYLPSLLPTVRWGFTVGAAHGLEAKVMYSRIRKSPLFNLLTSYKNDK